MTSHKSPNGLPTERGSQSPPKTLESKRPAHACDRCRSRHQKCHLGSAPDRCSNCERSNTTCEFKTNNELQIRFSKIRSTPIKRRKPNQHKATLAEKRVTASPESLRSAESWHEPNSRRHSTNVVRDAINIPVNFSDVSDIEAIAPDLELESPQVLGTHNSHESTVQLTLPNSPWNKETRSPWMDSSLMGTENFGAHNSSMGQDLWTLSEEEALLVKYFFEKLVSWFDFCDPEMRFRTYLGTQVLRDAATCYAVLAVAARHRETTAGTFGARRSEEYERRCFEILIPSLDNIEATLQESVLASALLLRLLDEMTEPADGGMAGTHAVSAPMLLQIRRGNFQASTLSDALLVVALRQEIYIANMTQRTFDEEIWLHCNVDDSLEPASDATWAFRIIGHASRVTNYAYGESRKKTQRWDELWQYMMDWDRLKPISFRPLFHSGMSKPSTTPSRTQSTPGNSTGRKKDRTGIPRILYAWDCPIAAQQYFQLCRILLLAHDPRAPVLSLGRASFLRQQEEQIRDAVRVICGIAMSNPEYWPTTSCASLSVAMCGELFSDPEETKQLLAIISRNEAHLGWPCLRVARRLQEFWNSLP